MIKDDKLDRRIWFDSYRQAMAKAILKAMNHKPDVIWLLENQKEVRPQVLSNGSGLQDLSALRPAQN